MPVVPQKLRSRKSVRVCQCGDKHCLTGIGNSPGWVSISKPRKIPEKKQKSGAQRDKTAVALKRARMEAHWQCFSPPRKTKVLNIGLHHMHPFALKKFRLAKRDGRRRKFSSFVLSSANVVAAVQPEEHKYFHFFSGGCLPKLNYPPELHRRHPGAFSSGCEALGSSQDVAEEIATRAVHILTEKMESTERELQAERGATSRVEPQPVASSQDNSPHRPFFTAAFHCGELGFYRVNIISGKRLS